MAEEKTFGELSLNDVIYYANKSEYGILNIQSIQEDGRDHIKVILYGNEEFSLPSGEITYDDKDEEMKLTTSKQVYGEWRKPFIVEEITKLEKKKVVLQMEIDELAKQLT